MLPLRSMYSSSTPTVSGGPSPNRWSSTLAECVDAPLPFPDAALPLAMQSLLPQIAAGRKPGGLSRRGHVRCHGAEVAELADAPDSKSGGRKAVWVRFPPSALITPGHPLLMAGGPTVQALVRCSGRAPRTTVWLQCTQRSPVMISSPSCWSCCCHRCPCRRQRIRLLARRMMRMCTSWSPLTVAPSGVIARRDGGVTARRRLLPLPANRGVPGANPRPPRTLEACTEHAGPSGSAVHGQGQTRRRLGLAAQSSAHAAGRPDVRVPDQVPRFRSQANTSTRMPSGSKTKKA